MLNRKQKNLLKMQNHILTIKDVEFIKSNSQKQVDSDGSIIFRLPKFYRFNDVSVMISSICNQPYNEIEIHGKLQNSSNGNINDHFSFCEAEASDEIFDLLVS